MDRGTKADKSQFSSHKPKIIAIVGPTASGKSSLAVELALKIDGEIISADSMQVYKSFNIGTAKPDIGMMQGVTHHMIDLVNGDENFTASDFRERAAGVIEEIRGRNKNIILAGGTGLYIKALAKGLCPTPAGDKDLRKELNRELEEKGAVHLHNRLKKIDPVAASGIHCNNVVRVIRALEVAIISEKKISDYHSEHKFAKSDYDLLMLGIDIERTDLYKRIEERVDDMIANGLKKEVEALLARGFGRTLKPMQAVGYKEMCDHILDGISLDATIELIKRNSRRYAKRQLTWFRKEDVEWMPIEELRSKAMIDKITYFLY